MIFEFLSDMLDHSVSESRDPSLTISCTNLKEEKSSLQITAMSLVTITMNKFKSSKTRPMQLSEIKNQMFYILSLILNYQGKVSLKKRKKKWTFKLLVRIPPLKSVKLNWKFLHTLTETYFGNKNLFFHL